LRSRMAENAFELVVVNYPMLRLKIHVTLARLRNIFFYSFI
jgi:hypothetical protein